MKYKAVLFDLYNTLVDLDVDETSSRFWNEIAGYLSKYGDVRSPETLKSSYEKLCSEVLSKIPAGHSALEIVFPVFLNLPKSQKNWLTQKEIQEFAAFFRRSSIKQLTLRQFVRPLIAELKQSECKVAIVSNTEAMFTRVDLCELEIDNLFDAIILSSDVGAEKPSPEPFMAALKELDAKPQDAVFIGDNPIADIMGAHNVGMESILISKNNLEDNLNNLPPDCLGVAHPDKNAILKLLS